MDEVIDDRIILGIDPGSNVMGYGVLKWSKGRKPELVTMGVFDLRKYKDHYLTLKKVFEMVTEIIDLYHPDEMCLEAPFFGKNVQSMLKLGRAQGVAMAAGLHRDLPITEYAPLKIKMAITGNGQASKEQVADMIKRMLSIPQDHMPKFLDATDAVGVAMCHYFQISKPVTSTKAYSSWKDFAKKNASRVRGSINDKNKINKREDDTDR
ncbi:MAG: crossover junction endodeoxyribonuclease RuvC [Paludibacteraceae bacterium]|nr:crossover junction endodeoxyribonuclease RuvC [Paludibacteraceae bacterium]